MQKAAWLAASAPVAGAASALAMLVAALILLLALGLLESLQTLPQADAGPVSLQAELCA